MSDLGKLLPRLQKGKAFAAVTRKASAFEIHWATKPAEKSTVEFQPDAVLLEQEGGVTLAFCGRSLGLRLIDLVNNTGGGIGGSSVPCPIRAFYLLAEGETWNVSKDGVVTITR